MAYGKYKIKNAALICSEVAGKCKAEIQFLSAFLRFPLSVGSVCPSSRALTGTLLQCASVNTEGLLIDLGAGSGCVTQELLRAGIAPDRILAIEASAGFAAAFARNCPDVPLILGDARNLTGLLDQYAPGRNICSIISSLPFRVIPKDAGRDILREIREAIRQRGGSLIQYSYAWWMRYPLQKYGFRPRTARMVLRNLPPARVEAYALVR